MEGCSDDSWLVLLSLCKQKLGFHSNGLPHPQRLNRSRVVNPQPPCFSMISSNCLFPSSLGKSIQHLQRRHVKQRASADASRGSIANCRHLGKHSSAHRMCTEKRVEVVTKYSGLRSRRYRHGYTMSRVSILTVGLLYRSTCLSERIEQRQWYTSVPARAPRAVCCKSSSLVLQ